MVSRPFVLECSKEEEEEKEKEKKKKSVVVIKGRCTSWSSQSF